MNNGYTDQLNDGRPIYIPQWPVTVAFENLTQVCKMIGQENVINISTTKNVPATMVALMGSDDPKATTELVIWFVQQARIDGEKINKNSMDDLGMPTIVELFTHVLHSQYNDFFESGLAKAVSQES